MRFWLYISALLLISCPGFADGPEFNIIGQKSLSTIQGQPITIQLTDLVIEDAEEYNYPEGFRLRIYDGENYLAYENTIYPMPPFTGQLEVIVRVRKRDDESQKYRLIIDVKPVGSPDDTAPVITGQRPLTIWVNTAVTIELSDLIVSDENNTFPGDFTLEVSAGDNYTLTGHVVTPVTNFVGELTVPVRVNDGTQYSEPFDLKIEVVNSDADAGAPLDIPSAFTPNNDNANDTWRIRQLRGFSEEYRRATLKVYDRKGQLVYETRGFDRAWDGRYNGELLPPDVYFYTIEVDITNPKKNATGVVSILR